MIGNFGSIIISWLSTTSVTVSAFTMAAIAIDRLMIVTRPLHAIQLGWKVLFMIVILWLSSSMLGIVYFLRAKYVPLENVCRTTYATPAEDYAHTLLLFVFQVAFPICLLTSIYSVILQRLKPVDKLMRTLTANYEQMMKIRTRTNKKAVKLFLTIVIIFYLLVLPFHICYLIYTFHIHPKRLECKTIVEICQVLMLLYFSNSCVNPIIYSRLHVSCRNGFIRLICMCCRTQIAKHKWSRDISLDMIRSIDELRDVTNSIRSTPLGTPQPQRVHLESSRSNSPKMSRVSRRSSKGSAKDSQASTPDCLRRTLEQERMYSDCKEETMPKQITVGQS